MSKRQARMGKKLSEEEVSYAARKKRRDGLLWSGFH
jgi:hypothetical protein